MNYCFLFFREKLSSCRRSLITITLTQNDYLIYKYSKAFHARLIEEFFNVITGL
jgi:hypothetical protein